MERKTGYIAGVALTLQAIPHMILFIVLAVKKNKLWKTMLPLGLVGLLLGVGLMIPQIIHEVDKIRMVDAVWGNSGNTIKSKAKKKNNKYYFEEPFGFASDFQIDETNIPEDDEATDVAF